MRIKLLKAFILTFIVISGFSMYINFNTVYTDEKQPVDITFGGEEIKSSGSANLIKKIVRPTTNKSSGNITGNGEVDMNPSLKTSPLKQFNASKGDRLVKSYAQTGGEANYTYRADNKTDQVEIYSGSMGLNTQQNGYVTYRTNRKKDDPELLAMQSISPQMLQTSRILAGTKINPAAATGVKSLASTTLDEIPFADAQLYGTTLTDDYVDPGGEDPVFLPVGDGLWILLMMSLCFAVYKRRSFTVN